MTIGQSFSFMVAAYNYTAELLRVYGSFEALKQQGKYDALNKKYFNGKNSLFNLKYKEVGDIVDDAEILHYYNKIKLLPIDYQKVIFDNDFFRILKHEFSMIISF